jgi:hypothetical protein
MQQIAAFSPQGVLLPPAWLFKDAVGALTTLDWFAQSQIVSVFAARVECLPILFADPVCRPG